MDQIVCLNPGSRVIPFRSDSGGFARRTRTMGPAFRAARSHRTQAMRSNRGVWNSRTTPPCASRTRPSTRGYTGRNSGSPASAVSCRQPSEGRRKRSGRQSRRNARSGSCPPSSCPAKPPRTVGGQDDPLWSRRPVAKNRLADQPRVCAGPSFVQRCANGMIRHRLPKNSVRRHQAEHVNRRRARTYGSARPADPVDGNLRRERWMINLKEPDGARRHAP